MVVCEGRYRYGVGFEARDKMEERRGEERSTLIINEQRHSLPPDVLAG